MTEAVSQAAKMKLEVAISFEDSKPKPGIDQLDHLITLISTPFHFKVRPRYDSAPSEPDALNKKMDNRNANNFRKVFICLPRFYRKIFLKLFFYFIL